tara:strand:+ start:415 stop:603 length:189 start_codon:yes stop_codon:yes gene_type:complete
MSHWLKKNIHDVDGLHKETYADYIDYFINTLYEIITYHGYVIKDDKKFKEEITHFIKSNTWI